MASDVPPVQRLIERFEEKTSLVFKPSAGFYQKVGINPYRFAQLVRGQKNPDLVEIRQLMGFFAQFFPVVSADLL